MHELPQRVLSSNTVGQSGHQRCSGLLTAIKGPQRFGR